MHVERLDVDCYGCLIRTCLFAKPCGCVLLNPAPYPCLHCPHLPESTAAVIAASRDAAHVEYRSRAAACIDARTRTACVMGARHQPISVSANQRARPSTTCIHTLRVHACN